MDKKRLRFKREEDYLVYQNNERERNRVSRKVEWEVFRSEGLCGICGNECIINKRTNKTYSYCELHRKLTNEKHKIRYRRKHPIIERIEVS